MERDHQYYMNRMKPLGKFIYRAKIARAYADGGGMGYVWNYWNPLAWPFIIFVITANLVIMSLDDFIEYPEDSFLRVKKWFRTGERKIEWL